MEIKNIGLQPYSKTNFGLITDKARQRLSCLMNQKNSGMDEDGRIKLSYFETSPDFILHYYEHDNSFKFMSVDYHASTGIQTNKKFDKNINVGNFLRKLFTQSQKLPEVEKTAAKREKPLKMEDIRI